VSDWVKLCDRDQLPPEGEAKEFRVHDVSLCVATLRGTPHAVNNVCPHRGGPLAEGHVEHGRVVCPWHQWEFDLVTGVSTHSQNAKVTAYPLQQAGNDILVKL
jgi:nitrite reductase (NADH) small subunit